MTGLTRRRLLKSTALLPMAVTAKGWDGTLARP